MADRTHQLRETANVWRSRLDTGDLSEGEREEFDAWIAAPSHARAFAEAELLWHALGKADLRRLSAGTSIQPAARVDSAVEASASLLNTRTIRRRHWVPVAFALAATLVLGAVMLPWPPGNSPPGSVPETFQTAIGEVSSYSLSDGSRLTLGARSQVRVTMAAASRQAELVAGEAVFEVSTDSERPFLVRSGAALVRVTGTAFDVKRVSDSLRVGVLEGSVEVLHPKSITAYASIDTAWQPLAGEPLERVLLKPGEQVIASRGAGLETPKPMALQDIGAWRTGKLVFFRTRLDELVSDIARYSASPLEIAVDARDLRVTATFDTSDLVADVAQTLSALEAALPLRIERHSDGTLFIRRASTATDT